MTTIKGIGASSGIALAKAYKLEMPDLTVTRDTVADPAAEVESFREHKAAVEQEILKIKEKASKNLSEEEAAVFDAHIQMLNDPELGKCSSSPRRCSNNVYYNVLFYGRCIL